MPEVVVAALANLVWLAVMFVPLERAFKARDQRVIRRGVVTDLLFFFGQHLLFASAAIYVIDWAVTPLDTWQATAGLRSWFGSLQLWHQLIAVVVLGDFVAYWGHRLQHSVDFLWRFHAVHHTSTEVDWLAAHREHPLDGVYTQALVNLPAILLGFSLAPVLGIGGRVKHAWVSRWPNALYQLSQHHRAQVPRIASVAQFHGPIQLAGAACDGVGVSTAIASGLAAADRLLGRI